MPDLTLLKPFNLDTTGNFTFATANVTGNLSSGNANLGNLVSANYFSGNGSLLTGLPAGYANSDVAAYLPTYTGNVSANYFIGNGSTLTFITGSNVSGNVTSAVQSHYANIANSVAGSNVSGTVSSATTAGTVTTAAQPNITSVGTLSSLSVTGDISSANLTLTGNLIVSGTTTSVNSTTTRIIDPIFELGGGANGAALTTDDNKDRGLLLHYYSGASTVDAFIGWDDSNGEFGFGSNVSVAGEVVTWNNYGNIRAGNFIGNGAFLTGVGAASAGFIVNGTSNVNIPTGSGNVTTSVGGTSNVTIVTSTGINIAGYVNATGNVTGSYILGNGALLTGIDAAGRVVNGTSNLNIATANGNVTTSVGGVSNVVVVTSTGVNVAGYVNTGVANVTANYFVGNGALLTGLDAAGRVVNGTSNISIPVASGNVTFGVGGTGNVVIITTTGIVVTGSGSISAASGAITGGSLTGPLTTAAQPNITSVGTLTSVTVTGNANVGNINTGGNVYANSGIVKGQYIYGDGSNLTGLGGAGYIFNGTSNVYIPSSGANVYFTVGLTPNIVTVTSTGVNVAGYVDAGSGAITTTGNITSGNANLGNLATANYFSGNLYGTANNASTVTTAAQPNITSLGTLANLTVTGSVNLGTVSNINISGGAANYFLKTDGSGGLSWAVPAGGGGGGGTSLTYTAGTTPPASGNILGDQWFNTSANVLYEYISDGTSSYWVDISGATTTTTTPTTLDLANVTIAGGSNGQVLTSNGAGGLSFANLTQANIYNGNSNVTVVANSNVTFSIAGTSNVLTVTSTGANLINAGTANLGNLVTANYVAGTLTTGAQPNITSIGILSSLTVTGAMTYGLSIDNLAIKTGATGVVTHDVTQGGSFYHTSPVSNFTANFTNVTLSDSKATVVALIIVQGATPYVPTTMQIDGQTQTVKWNLGASNPGGTASKTDIISYTIVKISGFWTVYGQYTYYG